MYSASWNKHQGHVHLELRGAVFQNDFLWFLSDSCYLECPLSLDPKLDINRLTINLILFFRHFFLMKKCAKNSIKLWQCKYTYITLGSLTLYCRPKWETLFTYQELFFFYYDFLFMWMIFELFETMNSEFKASLWK